MPIETQYVAASGTNYNACVYVGHRFDSDIGFRPREIESWVMRNLTNEGGSATGSQYGAARWYTGIWQSPQQRVYVCDGDGEVHFNPSLSLPDANANWTRQPFHASLFGIFGLDDEHVWTWGQRQVTTGVMFFWNGGQWKEIPAPEFEVVHVHGTSPNLLFAVGRSGGIAQWDGTSWRRWSAPVAENLNSVFVVSEDEIYATGDGGSLLEGSKHGWAKIAQGPGPGSPLLGVAKWNDRLWIAAGPFGLLRRVGTTDQLEVYKEKILATSFDVRKNLVVTTPNNIWSPVDGDKFKGAGRDMLLNQRAGKRLLDVS